MRLLYRVVVYYEGPKSSFSGKIDENEIVFERDTLWLWHARMMAKVQSGNTGRCGYAIMRGAKVIEKGEAKAPVYGVHAAP